MFFSAPRQLSHFQSSAAFLRTWSLAIDGLGHWRALGTTSEAGLLTKWSDVVNVNPALPPTDNFVQSTSIEAPPSETQSSPELFSALSSEELGCQTALAAKNLRRNWTPIFEIERSPVSTGPLQTKGPFAHLTRFDIPSLSTLCACSPHRSFATSAPQTSPADQSADSAGDDAAPSSSGSSWFGRVKGMLGMGGKKSEEKQEETFTLESKAVRVLSLPPVLPILSSRSSCMSFLAFLLYVFPRVSFSFWVYVRQLASDQWWY